MRPASSCVSAPFAALECPQHFELEVLETQVHVGVSGRVQAVVESPIDAVRVPLDASLQPAVQVRHQLLGIDAQVAVRVAHQPQAPGFADEHAAIEHLQRPRQHQSIREHRPLVHLAVVVGVFEHHDIADPIQVRLRRIEVPHEAGHLDHPQPAFEVPVHHDGILHQRLARHQLEVIAGRHEERLQRLGRRQRRRLVADLLHSRRPRTIGWRALSIAGDDAGRHEERDRAESHEEHIGSRVSGLRWSSVFGLSAPSGRILHGQFLQPPQVVLDGDRRSSSWPQWTLLAQNENRTCT